MSMEYKALCVSCTHAQDISRGKSRWDLAQLAKEVFNQLMKMGFDSKDFCYCKYLEEIRSLVAELDCYDYLTSKVSNG